MKNSILFFILVLFHATLHAHPSYTAYSGAPTGSKGTCASSCHGSGTGTITLTGIPASYIPLKAYTLTVKHTSGSTISNFNASSRKGATSTVAGTFTSSTNSALYSVSGYESGVRANSNSINEATFTWAAPAAGTGDVTIYLSGLQGTKSGTTTKLIITTSESTTGVAESNTIARSFALEQNYPNPFNPVTVINYHLSMNGHVSLKIFDVLGNEVAALVNEKKEAGSYSVKFDGSKLSSGIYIMRLHSGDYLQSKKLMLVK